MFKQKIKFLYDCYQIFNLSSRYFLISKFNLRVHFFIHVCCALTCTSSSCAQVCYDFLFSGHTATATLLGAVWPLHAPWLAGRLFGPSLAAAVVFLISYERLHYTVDIVLALIIAALVLALHHVLLALGRLLPPDALPPACCRRRRPLQSSSVECAGGDASAPFEPRIRVLTNATFLNVQELTCTLSCMEYFLLTEVSFENFLLRVHYVSLFLNLKRECQLFDIFVPFLRLFE